MVKKAQNIILYVNFDDFVNFLEGNTSITEAILKISITEEQLKKISSFLS